MKFPRLRCFDGVGWRRLPSEILWRQVESFHIQFHLDQIDMIEKKPIRNHCTTSPIAQIMLKYGNSMTWSRVQANNVDFQIERRWLVDQPPASRRPKKPLKTLLIGGFSPILLILIQLDESAQISIIFYKTT